VSHRHTHTCCLSQRTLTYPLSPHPTTSPNNPLLRPLHLTSTQVGCSSHSVGNGVVRAECTRTLMPHSRCCRGPSCNCIMLTLHTHSHGLTHPTHPPRHATAARHAAGNTVGTTKLQDQGSLSRYHPRCNCRHSHMGIVLMVHRPLASETELVVCRTSLQPVVCARTPARSLTRSLGCVCAFFVFFCLRVTSHR
jgi:hypothetical protein